jgi:hypothetical protein
MSLRRKLKYIVSSKLRYYSKPAFLIIGAQKAGTSALFNYLASHPDIVVPKSKELHFFDSDQLFNYKNQVWYNSQFPWPHELMGNKITFEATPCYLYNFRCAIRIYNYNPNLKLIISLREPVQRAFSAWNMYFSFKKTKPEYAEWRTFDEVIEDEIQRIDTTNFDNDFKGIVKRGIYIEQILEYLKYFPKEQIFIFEDIQLKNKTDLILSEITKFLNISDHNFVTPTNEKLHIGEYISEIAEDSERKLKKFYASYNDELCTLLDRNFEWNYL